VEAESRSLVSEDAPESANPPSPGGSSLRVSKSCLNGVNALTPYAEKKACRSARQRKGLRLSTFVFAKPWAMAVACTSSSVMADWPLPLSASRSSTLPLIPLR
jgi:hypothetical protein